MVVVEVEVVVMPDRYNQHIHNHLPLTVLCQKRCRKLENLLALIKSS